MPAILLICTACVLVACAESSAAPLNTSRLSLKFCADQPIWAAVQSEDGPWTRITPGADSTYTMDVGSRAGVAVVYGSTYQPDYHELSVLYGSAADLTSLAASARRFCQGDRSTTTRTLHGRVTGFGDLDGVSIGMRDALTRVTLAPGQSSADYDLYDAPSAASDLVAV